MVDVGYFIDGRHGVIRNVMQMSNKTTEHLCFTQIDGDEQYALKKENIEYVIPHEMSCQEIADGLKQAKEYMDDSVKENWEEDDEPLMTFAEKFKEVFGFEPNVKGFSSLCEIMNCDCRDNCQGCLYDNNNDWDAPYMKPEVEN